MALSNLSNIPGVSPNLSLGAAATNPAFAAINTPVYRTDGVMVNRIPVHASAMMLARALPYLVTEKFGQTYVLPSNSSKVCSFRRWEALDATPNFLTEGVTPAAKAMSHTDVSCLLKQMGDVMAFTDVTIDTVDSPVLKYASEVLGEQAAEMVERMRLGVLLAGTNVVYSNGSARNAVNTTISATVLRKALRALKNQKARPITSIVRSNPSFNTENVSPSYVAVCHPDLEFDLRDKLGTVGWVDAKNYGTISPWENEIGSFEGIRFITSTLMDSWKDAGGAKGSMLSTTGTSADVYPILIFGKDAYGIVPLKGANAITTSVVNPKACESDPLGQRGYVGWKTMQTCVILNQLWMARIECAVTAL